MDRCRFTWLRNAIRDRRRSRDSSRHHDFGRAIQFVAVIATALGVALAMLGPGAWSLDARAFGRKRIV
jgi:hypothetical protein